MNITGILDYFYGILSLSPWTCAIILALMVHFTILGVTLYLHRCMCHRGLELHPIISHPFRCWLWMTTGMVTKEWIAIHRKHHAKCETLEDPHSPAILGLNKVLWEGAELYRAAKKDASTMERYGYAAPDDWVERNVYTRFSSKGVFLMLFIDVLLFGIYGVSMWAIQMMSIPLLAAGVVNGIGHAWGYRNFESPDTSRNITPVAFILCGEELHNNHHAYGSSAKFSAKWWEFDLGWLYIRLFQWFGLAKVRRQLCLPTQAKGKNHIDNDTLAALITHRFQVMGKYTQEVILPTLRQEQQHATDAGKRLFAKAKGLFRQELSLVTEAEKQQMAELSETSTGMKHVLQLRHKLYEIWQQTTASQKELLDALQEWCCQAEETGIEALKQFAQQLRRYQLRVA
jgi:stearoyl-CoA desaturase (Delta-9 desaturase)